MRFVDKHKLSIITACLSLVFIVLINYSANSERVTFVEDGTAVILNPVQGILYKLNVNIKETFGFLFNYKRVKEENKRLKEINNKLQRFEIENKLLKKENNRLRKMLNFIQSSTEDYKYIGCDIIGISGNSFFDGFIINRGSKDGIKKRMVAVTADGLVGQVTAVGTNWAIVQTLSNENIAVAGYVERNSFNNGIIKGYKDDDNKLLYRIEIPTLESDIKVGDVILTSGIGRIYPKGIKVGKVINVIDDKGQISKYGIIKPYVDINRLEEIFIVIPKEERNVKY
ncbi:cell shape-determining protein MreC precursor [Clostridium tepidiprofundi DSM 19306]|uniref:Cell shape-determining protein MreC n=1 Tax=Clostridium tepidiprofundi DSM 19306 TaxID=1121338 RepID=A0A151B3I1_9CLOT|nr:rod shape-determining protein MreC [Clostridium tepidiprofundi]KYH34478.1 cell shape-determining protein MreC precursor [Clostridium tepidiprofundi DSM 19306]